MAKTIRKITPNDQRPKSPGHGINWHKRGYWVKNHKGQKVRCGKDPDDPDEAVTFWLNYYDRDRLGVPQVDVAGDGPMTVKELGNRFLDHKSGLLEDKAIQPLTYIQCEEIIGWFVDKIGPDRTIDSLNVADFNRLRRGMSELSLTSAKNKIMMVRSAVNWGSHEDQGFYAPVAFGLRFRKPASRDIRKEKRNREKKTGKKQFSASEIWQLLGATKSLQMRAMIMLGINLGYENVAISELTLDELDAAIRDKGYIDLERHKTGAERVGKLWPETRELLEACLKDPARPTALREFSNRVFITKRGQSWVCTKSKRNSIACEFRKLKMTLGWQNRVGVAFYALRHTFQTVGAFADVPNVRVVVQHMMGHLDESMSDVYTEGVPPKLVKKVSKHVRSWLFEAKPADFDLLTVEPATMRGKDKKQRKNPWKDGTRKAS